MQKKAGVIFVIALFGLAFAPTAKAITLPVDTRSAPASSFQTAIAAIMSEADYIVASIEASVGNLALAITGQGPTFNRSLSNTASVDAAVISPVPVANGSDASTMSDPSPVNPPPIPITTAAAPSSRDGPSGASDNIFELESTVAQLSQGMKGLTTLFASQTPNSKIESQIAALQSALSSQSNQSYDASAVIPQQVAAGGAPNGIAAASNIGQLSGVTITNANLTASEIPALDYLSLSGGTLGGDLELNGNATTTGASYFTGNVGIGTTSPQDALALNGSAYLASITAPTNTANRLYANGGSLYWAGSVIAGGATGNWTSDGTSVWRTGGYVGVGTSSPFVALSVVGNGYFTGSLTAASSTLGNATSTSIFSPIASFTNAVVNSFNASLANIVALTATNATTTNLYVSNTASIGTLSGFLKANNGTISTSTINLSSDASGVLPLALGGTGTSSATGILSNIQFLQATSTAVVRTLQGKLSDTISVKDFGAAGNALSYKDGTITSGTNTLSSNTAIFTSADVGKVIWIDYAGSTGAPLQTTISGFTDSHHVTLAANAQTSVPYSFLKGVFVSTSQSGAGSYAPGDTITLSGGTASVPAVLTVERTNVSSATLVSGGASGSTSSGASSGSCTLTGTTGSGERKFSINATLTSGVVTSLGSLLTGGEYSANPTSLSAEPVTGCGNLTGATVSLIMGVLMPIATTQGTYSATAGTLTQSSTSGSGTGATFTSLFVTGGTFVYGTDDTAALTNAFNYESQLNQAGSPACVSFPGGIYVVTSALPTFYHSNGCVEGAGRDKTFVYAAPSLAGDVMSWSEDWAASTYPFGAPTPYVSQSNTGPIIKDMDIIGDQSSTNVQNGITFFDRDDSIDMEDVEMSYLTGSCLRTGYLKNTTQSYIRESQFDNIRCFNSGSSTSPAMDIGTDSTGDGTNEIDFNTINIYAPNGPGFVIRSTNLSSTRTSGTIRVNQLRVEGQEGDIGLYQGDLVRVGDSSLPGAVTAVHFDELHLVNPYLGYAAMRLTADSSTDQPYGITVTNGDMTASPGFGRGLEIDAGRNNTFSFWPMSMLDYGLYVGAAPMVGGNNIVSSDATEGSLYAYIDPSAVSDVLTQSAYQSINSVATTTGYTNNTATGINALLANTTGGNNTALGYNAGAKELTGIQNVFLGSLAGQTQSAGNANVYVGYGAGQAGTSAFGNTCIGSSSCWANLQGSNNTVIGGAAGYKLTTGSSANIIIGIGNASDSNQPTTDKDSILIGDQLSAIPNNAYARLDIGNLLFGTGLASTTNVATGSIGIGTTTPWGRFAVTGIDTSVSTPALDVADSNNNPLLTVMDNGNTTINGSLTLNGATTTLTNGLVINAGCIFINGNCLSGASGAQTNAANTWTALQYFQNGVNTSGTSGGYQIDGNTILQASTTNGSLLLGLGAGANLLASSTMAGNVALGPFALNSATSSSYNTAVGFWALEGSTVISNSGFNTAVGYRALASSTLANNNTAMGYSAGAKELAGIQNVFLGSLAGQSQSSGNSNVYVGYGAGQAGTTAFGNTCIGANSCWANLQGSNNTVIGGAAGYNLTTGSSENIIIGSQAATNGLTTAKETIEIGDQLQVLATSSYAQLDIGNLLFGTGLASTTNISSGNIGIGTSTPYSRLEVFGTDAASSTSAFAVVNSASSTVFAVFDGGNAQLSGTLTQSSDQRLKTNIQDLDGSSSLAEINALNPVTFNWIDPEKDGRTQFGFIAQQVQGIFPSLVSTTSPTALTPDGTLGLNYIDLISPIIAAIQELDKEITSLASTVSGFAQSITTAVLNATTGNSQRGQRDRALRSDQHASPNRSFRRFSPPPISPAACPLPHRLRLLMRPPRPQ